MSYTINDAYMDVKLFNTLAGNLKNVTGDSIDAQISFCFEELSEAITSFEEGDKVNFQKEVCDMFVVLAGLMQKMQVAGYDIEGALERVNANNLTKFPRWTGAAQAPNGWTVEVNEAHNRYMFKDSVGKIKKPLDYVETDMTGLAVGDHE